jgi:hypothetical protein
MKKVFIGLFVADILLALYAIFVGKGEWLINSQVAFFSSTLVVFASMLSYRSMVQGRLDVGAIPDDERDTLDKLEDPYDLYDEARGEKEEKTLVEVVKEERKNLKKSSRSFWEATKDSKASLSIYRLLAYALLVLGFFYLNTNKILELAPFLIALGIPPVIIVFSLLQNKE